MDGFRSPDGRQVAVPLQGEGYQVRVTAFYRGRYRRSAAVRRFQAIEFKKVIRGDSAADR